MHRSTATLSPSGSESGCKWHLRRSLEIWPLEALRQHPFRSMSMLRVDIFNDPGQNHNRIAHHVCRYSTDPEESYNSTPNASTKRRIELPTATEKASWQSPPHLPRFIQSFVTT